MSDIKKLHLAAKGISILYVEDNTALRDNATKLLKKFFENVYDCVDGKEALDVFKKYHSPLVLTDIKMPRMDGMVLAKEIKHIRPETKIIFMSAFDEKEYLHEAINVGAFRFLKKPVNISMLTETLLEALLQIKHEHRVKLFYTQLKNIFNYQSSMVVMINSQKPIVANQVFLDFFGALDIEEFLKVHSNIGDLCLAHDGFLYNHDDKECFEELYKDEGKLHHVKMKNTQGEIRHLILKLQKVAERENYSVVSFEDVTELNLLKLFDERASKTDENVQNRESMINLLEVIQRNSAKIQLHNYYKGLSITNDAIIVGISDDSITLKTNFLQQKAVQHEQKCLIVSDTLPHVIACNFVDSISFEKQTVVLQNFRFITSSPVTRKTIRVVPKETHTVSLFFNENKFQGDVSIVDVSLDAVKLRLNALPAGLVEGVEVIIDMILELDKRPLIINTKAIMFRKTDARYSFDVVFRLDLKANMKNSLVKYITKRQMAIIREFKGLQNG